VLLGGVALCATFYYIVWGRKYYDPPLNSIHSDEILASHEAYTVKNTTKSAI
jgi:hypothetical protein